MPIPHRSMAAPDTLVDFHTDLHASHDAAARHREDALQKAVAFRDDWRRALDAAGDDIVRTCVEIKFTARSS